MAKLSIEKKAGGMLSIKNDNQRLFNAKPSKDGSMYSLIIRSTKIKALLPKGTKFTNGEMKGRNYTKYYTKVTKAIYNALIADLEKDVDGYAGVRITHKKVAKANA